jgi:hypothetical protein
MCSFDQGRNPGTVIKNIKSFTAIRIIDKIINNDRESRKNIFLLAFLGFWLLTISHSATRIAAPAFIYVLALLQINFNGKDSIIENDSV